LTDQISLREYIDMRFTAQDKAVAAALASAERAVAKSDLATEKRFESVNEFRATLADSARLLMPRLEAEQVIRAISDKVEVLTTRLNARDDRGQGSSAIVAYIIAAVAVVTSILTVVFIARK
jgi:hypothetical protein